MSNLPQELSPEKSLALNAAIDALKEVPNVAALVLGGSHARGLATSASDLDIGIYYREAAPLPIPPLRAAAESISIRGSSPVVTELYGWGPWVNGGAWIQTPATKIDFLYRNIDQVRHVIEEGQRGVCRRDYEQQPPFGFHSVVYFAETHYCVPLHDPHGEVHKLKRAVAEYPTPLKNAIVQHGLWSAEFSMWSCDGFVKSAAVCNAAGCMVRAADYLVQAIFAWNEVYFLGDKQTAQILSQLPNRPRACEARLADVLSRPGANAAELRDSLESLRQIWREAVALTDGAYQPIFDLTLATNSRT